VRPRKVVAPNETVAAEHRAERGELEPAGEQLAVARHLIEAAGVGPPMRHARHAKIETDADLRLERGECRVDVAGPRHGAEALHARPAGPAQQIGPALWTIRRLALGKRLLAHQVVAIVRERRGAARKIGSVGRSFAAVEPPTLDVEIDQMAM